MRHQGKLLYADDNSSTVRVTGSSEEIDALYRLLEPFGVREIVKSGRIAVRKTVAAGIRA